jgi:phosphohistidine phosphatase
MRRLILLRHGKTEAMAASGDDFDRALLPRGQADTALIAKILLQEGLKPDLALVSSAVRARQTWEMARSVFGEVKTEIIPTLYLAPPERMRDLIEDWSGQAETLIVVGHNPGIHELAATLLREGAASASQIGKLQQGFPTATAAVFEIDEAGRAAYDGFFTPKAYGGGAGGE